MMRFVAALVLLFTTGAAAQAPVLLTDVQQALNLRAFDVVWITIRDYHWDPNLGGMDWDAVREELRPKIAGARTTEEYLDLMRGMIRRFDQSHFSITSSAVYEKKRNPDDGEFDGAPGFDVRVIDGLILVTSVDEDSPAAEAGVRTGWELVAVDGEPLQPALDESRASFDGKPMLGLVLHGIVEDRIIGAIGQSKSFLFVDGEGAERELDITFVRRKGNKYSFGVFPATYVHVETRRLDGNLGYIAFNAFMDPMNLLPAYEAAVKDCLDCAGLIIDVRGNGGGMPPVAMGMAGWLTNETDHYFGTMHTRDTELRFVVNPRPEPFNGPVAVLIDALSASASEIFAGGLRDMGRARLFGERTAGAVLPAHFKELPNGDFFYYPIADYYSANGERLEGIGVAPDVPAPHTRPSLLQGKDNALEAALLWLKTDRGNQP